MRTIGERTGPVRRQRLAIIAPGGALGFIMIGAGLAIAYLAFTTPLIQEIADYGGGEVGHALTGVLAWTFALLAPTLLIIVGVARSVGAVELLAVSRQRPSPVVAHAETLPDQYAVATGVRLEGRILDEVVAGPWGLAVIERLPSPAASRRQGHAWEMRVADGRWVPIENPLDRATRDAERLRRWVANELGDLAPRVFAGVVTNGIEVARSPGCAVITFEQIPDFLARLPPSRQMTPDRLEHVIELLRSAI